MQSRNLKVYEQANFGAWISGRRSPVVVVFRYEWHTKPNRTSRNLSSTMQQVSAMLKYRFAAQIAQNPKSFKKHAIRYLERYLPPGPGRPAEDSISRAIELRKQGTEWKQIYPQCIARHPQLSRAERRQAEYNLRAACRSRRNAARRRKRRYNSLAERTPPLNIPSSAQFDSGLKLGE